jgi:hypothetical protein
MNVHNPESKARLFEAVHTRYEKRFGGRILATSNAEIFTLCERVVGAAQTDDDDHVFDSVLTAIWMSPRESSARLRFTARQPADKVAGGD